jgi:hypothetical protein
LVGLEWFSQRKRQHSNDDENWSVDELNSKAWVRPNGGINDEIWMDLFLLDNLVDECEP